jgi:hypothetical protein
MYGYIRRSVQLLSVPLLLAGLAAGFSPVTAAARTASPSPASSFTINGHLAGVAAASAANAWAVGSYGSFSSPKSLIAHWNGAAWARVPSPTPAGGAELSGVAATSASSAWAVGCVRCFVSNPKPLILRWNGTAWAQVPSPATGGTLSSVTATSASSAWAVGTVDAKTLILRWNGTAWKRVTSPSPGASSDLASVAATSAGTAWAVGESVSGTSMFNSLVLHWDGTSWKRVPSPLPTFGKYGNALAGVAATSAANAWAVGCTDGCPVGGTPVIERWNGTAWKQVAPPTTPYAIYNLAAVAATSGTSAWAVGGGGPVTSESTASAQWNGHTWTLSQAKSGAELVGVAATSATNAWAVGGTANGHTLIMYWNGKAWK